MPKARILVVDDARATRELVRLHLTNAGYEVKTAEDAIVAGRQALEKPPHLIITDIDLPYMSGLQFVAALRDDPAVADIRSFSLRGRSGQQNKSACGWPPG